MTSQVVPKMVVRLWKDCVLQYSMVPVVLISVKWKVDWILVGRWDDSSMSVGPPGADQESSWLRLGDGKNGDEP